MLDVDVTDDLILKLCSRRFIRLLLLLSLLSVCACPVSLSKGKLAMYGVTYQCVPQLDFHLEIWCCFTRYV